MKKVWIFIEFLEDPLIPSMILLNVLDGSIGFLFVLVSGCLVRVSSLIFALVYLTSLCLFQCL